MGRRLREELYTVSHPVLHQPTVLCAAPRSYFPSQSLIMIGFILSYVSPFVKRIRHTFCDFLVFHNVKRTFCIYMVILHNNSSPNPKTKGLKKPCTPKFLSNFDLSVDLQIRNGNPQICRGEQCSPENKGLLFVLDGRSMIAPTVFAEFPSFSA